MNDLIALLLAQIHAAAWLQLIAYGVGVCLFPWLYTVVVHIASTVARRCLELSKTAARIVGEALGLAAVWPVEWAIEQAERALAAAADYRARRKAWRDEFCDAITWEEFRRQLKGEAQPTRDAAAEAEAVFGLSETFSRAELEARFRRLMHSVHPDKGGSEHLTRLVMAARTTILDKKEWKR
ncbi:DnaJ family molecular chaperone [Methylocella sp.]|uniref:DnaJ family molecular chaperone n=1 Tax=Methylocella sp. TaxID=1978226 RepID=UPI003782FD10